LARFLSVAQAAKSLKILFLSSLRPGVFARNNLSLINFVLFLGETVTNHRGDESLRPANGFLHIKPTGPF
ncbi:MAG: hypothetical protein KAG97_05835, partial [Victivallales bacterium]|nr:hypothetical protein [Victivallales bacterium]